MVGQTARLWAEQKVLQAADWKVEQMAQMTAAQMGVKMVEPWERLKAARMAANSAK